MLRAGARGHGMERKKAGLELSCGLGLTLQVMQSMLLLFLLVCLLGLPLGAHDHSELSKLTISGRLRNGPL